MKIAYLVLTHRNPKLLKRTIERLSSADSAFFVHVDRKSNIAPFSGIKGDQVLFSNNRLPVYWGEFSSVRAMMSLMRQALEACTRFDYFVHLSGSDYPLRSKEYIHSFFEANRGTEFITLIKVPAPGKPLSRITTTCFESHKPVRRFVSKVLAQLGGGERDFENHFGSMEPYSGRALWALSRNACRYLLEFVAQNPRVEKFFENTFAADEAFFHTILANSYFGARASGNLVYEDWSAYGSHPEMISLRHVELFSSREKVVENEIRTDSPECLFARKFSDQSGDVLDAVDAMIAQKEKVSLVVARGS